MENLCASGAYGGAIQKTPLDSMKPQVHTISSKAPNPPKSQIQQTNGHLEKPTATASMISNIKD